MKIEDIEIEINHFKEQFSKEINDFNERNGNYSLESLQRRFTSIDFPITDGNDPLYLGIGDLAEKLRKTELYKKIREFAEERGWKDFSPNVNWENDFSKYASVQHMCILGAIHASFLFSFDYVKEVRPLCIMIQGPQLIRVVMNDETGIKLDFDDFSQVISQLGIISRC